MNQKKIKQNDDNAHNYQQVSPKNPWKQLEIFVDRLKYDLDCYWIHEKNKVPNIEQEEQYFQETNAFNNIMYSDGEDESIPNDNNNKNGLNNTKDIEML